jgi:hypothetical protein
MYGFHASEAQCQYGLVLQGISVTLAALVLGMVALLA